MCLEGIQKSVGSQDTIMRNSLCEIFNVVRDLMHREIVSPLYDKVMAKFCKRNGTS
jgi:hypothetical protein